MLLCKKCGKKLLGKQTKFCSPRCSKNFLKSQYKRRHKDKVNEYNKKWRKLNKIAVIKNIFNGTKCYFCRTKIRLVKHHADYERELIVRLCQGCHVKLHRLLKYDNGKENLNV